LAEDNSDQQRNTTIALVALVVIAFAVRWYLDTRESFRFVDEPMTFVVSNNVAHFTSSRGTFARTNAELVPK
jgi:hypothetical protein